MTGVLDGQVAVITGAGEGIGRGVALELARAGADICVNDIRDPEEVQPLLAELESLGVRALYVRTDVRDRPGMEAMADRVESLWGPVSIVVSNAVTSQRHTLLDTPLEELVQAVDVGIYGAFHALQVFASRMVSHKVHGSIIQMTSPWAYLPYAGGMDYRIVKSAQHQMALSLATELMSYGIRVNVLEPGWVETEGEHRWHSAESMRQASKTLPLGRLCTPEETGRAAVYLCSEPYITGTHLKIDGGLTLNYYSAAGLAGTRPEDR